MKKLIIMFYVDTKDEGHCNLTLAVQRKFEEYILGSILNKEIQ